MAGHIDERGQRFAREMLRMELELVMSRLADAVELGCGIDR